MQSHASWVTGSLDQQLAQLASSCSLIRCQKEHGLLGQLLAYPVVPDELDDLAGIGVLVRRLGQPADHSLVVGTTSAPLPDIGGCK